MYKANTTAPIVTMTELSDTYYIQVNLEKINNFLSQHSHKISVHPTNDKVLCGIYPIQTQNQSKPKKNYSDNHNPNDQKSFRIHKTNNDIL